jgi:hypothetical protein
MHISALYFVRQIILNYEEGYCEKRENNYKPIGKIIVGKHEMSLRFISSYLYSNRLTSTLLYTP